MKKVGILTFHYADNYGAVLQAFALRKKICGFDNYQAEIINYVPKSFQYSLYANTEEARQMLIKKRKCFEKFLREECKVNTPMISEVAGNQYDYYCVGSDQVWNMDFSDNEYFFPHLNENDLRFSYAASIGMSLEKVLPFKSIFEKYVSKFKTVSVREQEHVEFVSDSSGRECSWVLDPTLLLSEQEYKSIIANEKLVETPFIFFFWLRHDQELMRGVEFVNMVSRKYHLPIIHAMYDAKKYTFNIDAGCMIYEGVENFLWYIKNASFVVTNSYHVTLFSMQFKTPFYVFVAQSMRSRVDLLKQKFHIDNRVVEEYISASDLNNNVDFGQIENVLQVEREKSVDYLKKALDIKE